MNFRFIQILIFFGNLRISISMKRLFQIECICLILESQSIFWSLLVNSYDKKLMPERLGDGSQTLCDSAVSRPNRFKKWHGKYLKIYCKQLSQYNESDSFRYR